MKKSIRILIAFLSLAVGFKAAAELKIAVISSFTAPDTIRNPFWPVGWKPVVIVPGIPTPQPPIEVKINPDDFEVTTISIGAISLAVINGNAYSEGEIVPSPKVQLPPGTPGVQVYSIRDGEVLLRFKDKLIKAKIKAEKTLGLPEAGGAKKPDPKAKPTPKPVKR